MSDSDVSRPRRWCTLLATIVLGLAVGAVVLPTSPAFAVNTNEFAWPATGHTDAADVAWHRAHENGARAVDVQAAVNTPVKAAQSGRVVVSSGGCDDSSSWGCGGGFGNYVIIRHDRTGVTNPLYTLYGHLKTSSLIANATDVNLGQQIGVIALSGSTTGPHTHFAIGTCSSVWSANASTYDSNCTIWNGADTSSATVTEGNAVPGTYTQLAGSTGGGGATNRVTGGGIASTRGPGQLDVFIQGTNATGANAYRNQANNGPFEGWALLENSGTTHLTSSIGSVSASPDRIDLFSRGESGELLHKWYDTAWGWGGWVSNGGCIIGAPTVTSWGPGRLDVFAQGCNATGPNLVHNWLDANGWHWETVAEGSSWQIASAPSATAWGSGRIDLFARGTTGELLHKWYDGAWSTWVSHGGCIIGAPAVSSWAVGRLDVFMRNCATSGNNVWHNWYDGANWWWETLPSSDNLFVTTILGAVSNAADRIDVFARSDTGEPVHKWCCTAGWEGWEHMGGGVAP